MRSDVLNTSSNSYGKSPEAYKFSAKTAAFTAVDGFAITFEADSASTSAGVFGGAVVKTDKQVQFDGVIPNITTLVPDDTSVSFGAKFTTGKSLAGGETKYQKDTLLKIDILFCKVISVKLSLL